MVDPRHHQDPQIVAFPLPGAPQAAIVRAVRRLLRPLVRLLIGEGITFPQLEEIVKGVYVETADGDFRIEGQRPTDSRINILTGVHRKDVRRLRREIEATGETPPRLALGTRIVARWVSDPTYLDGYHRPQTLPRTGPDPSFASLVEAVSKNVRPRSVLDELLRLGVVETAAGGRIRLVVPAFVPQQGQNAKAFYFGEAVHDHLSAGVHNLAGAMPPWLERSVYYDELSPASVRALALRCEELAMRMLQDVNREGLALEQTDPPAAGERMRMRLGVYFYAEPVGPSPATGPPPDTPPPSESP